MSSFASAFPALRAIAVAGVLPLAVLSVPAVAAANPTVTYTYVVSGTIDETHVASGEDGDTGLCALTETAHYAGSFRFRLESTQPGLTDEEVLGLRDAGPDPSVVSAEYVGGGSLVVESADHVYTTRWSGRDKLRTTSAGLVLSGRFTALGHSESGSPFAIQQSGRLVLVDGVPALNRERLSVRGCLP